MHWVDSWNPAHAKVIQGYTETSEVCSQATGGFHFWENLHPRKELQTIKKAGLAEQHTAA